jgi:hypothetical protein
VHKVLRVYREPLVLKALRVYREPLVLRVLKVFKVNKDSKAYKEQQDQLAVQIHKYYITAQEPQLVLLT